MNTAAPAMVESLPTAVTARRPWLTPVRRQRLRDITQYLGLFLASFTATALVDTVLCWLL